MYDHHGTRPSTTRPCVPLERLSLCSLHATNVDEQGTFRFRLDRTIRDVSCIRVTSAVVPVSDRGVVYEENCRFIVGTSLPPINFGDDEAPRVTSVVVTLPHVPHVGSVHEFSELCTSSASEAGATVSTRAATRVRGGGGTDDVLQFECGADPRVVPFADASSSASTAHLLGIARAGKRVVHGTARALAPASATAVTLRVHDGELSPRPPATATAVAATTATGERVLLALGRVGESGSGVIRLDLGALDAVTGESLPLFQDAEARGDEVILLHDMIPYVVSPATAPSTPCISPMAYACVHVNDIHRVTATSGALSSDTSDAFLVVDREQPPPPGGHDTSVDSATYRFNPPVSSLWEVRVRITDPFGEPLRFHATGKPFRLELVVSGSPIGAGPCHA